MPDRAKNSRKKNKAISEGVRGRIHVYVYAGEGVVLVCTIGGAPAPDCAWLAAIFEANWMPYQYCAALDDKRGTALTPMLTEGDNGEGGK